MNPRVRITEVAARDGLQNEPALIPAPRKVELLRRLALTGADEVEATSFVSPKWIPQLGDASEVLLAAPELGRITQVSALVPNEQGMRRLVEVNREAYQATGSPVVAKASVFAAASEGFSRKNTNATIAETIERFKPVVALAREHGLQTRGYISCVVRCPFDGPIAPEQVARVAAMLVGIGIDEIDLGDTIGAAEPEHIEPLISAVVPELRPSERISGDATWRGCGGLPLTLHLHDTFGRARECVIAALGAGVRSFDSSAAGLGGCPYASVPGRRAPGNLSTETLVATLRGAGYTTNIDADALGRAAAFAAELVADARSESR